MLASRDRQAAKVLLSPDQAHDAPEGRKLLRCMGFRQSRAPLLMDRAYEGDKHCQRAKAMGIKPIVPPLKSRLNPWKYDNEKYKKRNEAERLFRRWKGYRRVFSRFDNLDVVFS